METIRVAGREITPLFDLTAWEMIEDAEEFSSMSDALDAINDREDEKRCRRATLTIAAILCSNALQAAGEGETITRSQMLRATPPKRIGDVRLACVKAINKGLRSDYDEADEEPVDVVLEEIEKKQTPGG